MILTKQTVTISFIDWCNHCELNKRVIIIHCNWSNGGECVGHWLCKDCLYSIDHGTLRTFAQAKVNLENNQY